MPYETPTPNLALVKCIFIRILVCLLGCPCLAQPVNFQSSNLPIVKLNTNGQFIPDNPRIVAQMQVIDNGPGVLNYRNDAPQGYDGWITIETRGSTSQILYPKKSYGLTTIAGPADTTQINVGLLGFPEENDWVLYAPYPDKTLIRNALAFDLFRKMGRYASRVRFVELLLNEEYMGVYCLQEKVKRDADRVNISKLRPEDVTGDQLTGGYILKIDKITGNSGQAWVSTKDPQVFFLHHYPDEADMQPVQKTYIRNYLHHFETALQTGNLQDTTNGYRHYADAASFMDVLIMQELGRTVDGFRSSTFFYKDRDSKGGKLIMGPLWDFNLSYGNANYCDAPQTSGWQYLQNDICPNYNPHIPFWWQTMLSDPWFDGALKCRWAQLRSSTLHLDSIYGLIDTYAAELNESQQRNFQRWPILGVYVDWNPFIGLTYSQEINYLKTWLSGRVAWLDSQWMPGADCSVGAAEAVLPACRVFPNPAGAQLWLEWPVAGEKHLQVFDAGGQIIHTQRSPEINIPVNAALWPAGFYFFSVQDESGREARGKILRK